MRVILRLTVLVGLAVSLAACATQNYYTSETLRRDGRMPRILVMPPDIELYELDSAGNLDVNALWTRDAALHVTSSVRSRLTGMNTQFVEYVPPPDDSAEAETLRQVQKLHIAVGNTISQYHFDRSNRLPAKNDRFDWSLGPAVEPLARHADADYALFLWVRDSYATPGRVAIGLLVAAVAGVQIKGGQQIGHASLVDLHTGQVVWFNSLTPRGNGDLRSASSAGETVALLLDKLPK